MTVVLTLAAAGPALLEDARSAAAQAVASVGGEVKASGAGGPGLLDLEISGADPEAAVAAVRERLRPMPVDYALQAAAERRARRLFVADMDSTVVACECLDELADYAGFRAEVAAVTERSMRGEVPFEESLRNRVALLKGLELSALGACYRERVRLNAGAAETVAALRQAGFATILASGGFHPFTTWTAQLAGFDEAHGNRLVDDGTRLTGEAAEPILGAAGKRAVLERSCAARGFTSAESVAMGDGANDIPMILAAGLGVAFHAKPALEAVAPARIRHTGFETLLAFLGIAGAQAGSPAGGLA